MLEIIFLIWFGRKLSALAKEKGRSGMWAMLGVGMWIGGEVFGIGVGALLDLGMGAVLVGLVCALAGAGVSYGIVSALAPLEMAEDNFDSFAA